MDAIQKGKFGQFTTLWELFVVVALMFAFKKNIFIRGCVLLFFREREGREKDQCERETWIVCLWYAP